MERPFEGLQERTNEQMERKKKKKENIVKKKARDRIRKRRSREKADKDAEQAKQLEDNQKTKKIERQKKRKEFKKETHRRKQEYLDEKDAKEEEIINARFSFKPEIIEGDLDAVFSKPEKYEDPRETKIKATVNEARRNLYRARAFRSKKEDLVKREMRSSSHTSLAKAVLNKKDPEDPNAPSQDPAGVNLSLLKGYRKDASDARTKERECSRIVEKLEKKSKSCGCRCHFVVERCQRINGRATNLCVHD